MAGYVEFFLVFWKTLCYTHITVSYTHLDVYKRQEFYRNTIKNDDSYFKEYLLEIVSTLFYEAIDKLDEDKSLSDEDKKFYSQFYAYGICGVVVSWVESGMKEDTKKLSDKLKGLAQGSEKLGYEIYTNR